MKLFDFDIHIGDWRVLVQSNDIQNGAVQSRHITDDAVTTDKIGDGEVKSGNIAPEAVTTDKIGDREVKGMNIATGAVTNDKLADECITGDEIEGKTVKNGKIANDAIQTRNIKNRNITEPKLGDQSVSARALMDGNVTPPKVSGDFVPTLVLPHTNALDTKYDAITQELYSMIASLQVGGIALSNKCGGRTDIGIHQKALTAMLGKIWEELGRITGRDYFDFSLSVIPTFVYSEIPVTFTITADSAGTIGDFELIRIYVDERLVAESHDVATFTTTHIVGVSTTSVIRAEAVIMGKTVSKSTSVFNKIPFFIGSGTRYTDIMNDACHRELEGTLEGDYDVTVSNTGEKLFIIIPIGRKDEFRRADMNGVTIPGADGFSMEIPFNAPVVTEQYVVYESQNQYRAGTYNIDIDINT